MSMDSPMKEAGSEELRSCKRKYKESCEAVMASWKKMTIFASVRGLRFLGSKVKRDLIFLISQ